MGLVQRQSFKNSFITYAGLAVGALNLLFLLPLAFSADEIGAMQFVLRTGQMLFPFAMLGAGALVIRYFAAFRDEARAHHGFLTLVLGLALSGLCLGALLFVVFRDGIGRQYAGSPLLRQYLAYIVPMVVFLGLSNLLATYSANFHRIAMPALFNNLYVKVVLAGLIGAALAGVLDFSGFMLAMLLAYGSVVLLLLGYLRRLGQLRLRRPDWSFTRRHLRDMGHYAWFGILGSAGAMLATQIDTFMVGTLVGAAPVAAYTIGFFIADVIDVPRRSIESITAPLVAAAWQRDDRAHIGELYRKSALNQLILGLGLLLCVWTGLDSLFALIPGGERFAAGKEVVLILGIGKLFELGSGITRLVIVYSPRFRFEFYATLALAVFNVAANLLFIPLFQIAGAAMATSAVLLLYSLLKLGYVWRHFRLQPFSPAAGWALLLAAGLFVVAGLLPAAPHPLADLALRVPLMGGAFALAVYRLRLSPDINAMVDAGWRRLRGRG